jgi:oligopeptide transport system substrate-binding protein
LQVDLVGSTPHFLTMLSHYSFYPVNPRTVEAHGGMTDRQSGWSTLANYVGNGPFRLTKWDANQLIEVDRNPAYWDARTVKLNAIRFYPIENVNTEETLFRNDRLHMTGSVNSEKIAYFRKIMPDRITTNPYLGTYYYLINTTRPPFDDVRVRKALALSIDKQLLVDRVTKGGQDPATGFVPPGIPGYAASTAVPFDPERARKLLAEAGYPGGKGFPRAEILINTSEGHRKIAEAVQAMWRQQLGIDVGIYNQEWKVYLDSRNALDYQIARAGWIGDYVYPMTFLDMYVSGGGNNNTGFANPRYDQLIRDARTAPTAERRLALMHDAEAILLDEMPIIPIYWYTSTYLKDPRVKGWYPKLLDNHPYKYVWLESE